MSANNWEVCPRCSSAPEAQGVDRELFRTFGEYYEFYGADKGTVTADYRGECRVCHLKCAFTYGSSFFFVAEPS